MREEYKASDIYWALVKAFRDGALDGQKGYVTVVKPNIGLLIQALIDAQHDSEELVGILEISPEEILERFHDKIWKARTKIYWENIDPEDESGDDDDGEDEEDDLEGISNWHE